MVRRHLLAVVAGPAAVRVQAWRRAWDPVMAAVAPPHVTIAYPEEGTDEGLLLRRAESLLGTAPRFRLRLGRVFADGDGRHGVLVAVAVDDVDGGWSSLRRTLLAEPMTALAFPPHVTIAHPRTSSLGPECAAALAGQALDQELWIREVLHTETTTDAFSILRRFPLAPTTGQ